MVRSPFAGGTTSNVNTRFGKAEASQVGSSFTLSLFTESVRNGAIRMGPLKLTRRLTNIDAWGYPSSNVCTRTVVAGLARSLHEVARESHREVHARARQRSMTAYAGVTISSGYLFAPHDGRDQGSVDRIQLMMLSSVSSNTLTRSS